MKILLDTHIALWALSDDDRLSKKARRLIFDTENTIYYSSVSVWEILLKNESPRNNLTLTPGDFIRYCEEAGYHQLSMTGKHVVEAEGLKISNPSINHKDPFDRMLLAQAKSEKCFLMTSDEKILMYKEKCVISV